MTSASGTDKESQVFISWSGQRSQRVATALQEYIKCVMYSAHPWVSSKDIDAGSNWNPEIMKKLGEAKFGVICLTPENLHSEWIHFEAGAIAKQLSNKERVCPYLLSGVKQTDVALPLSMFHTVNSTKAGTESLFQSINKVLREPIDSEVFKKTFDAHWTEFETALLEIVNDSSYSQTPPARKIEDILAEILETTRTISRKLESDTVSSDENRFIRALGMYTSDIPSQILARKILQIAGDTSSGLEDRKDAVNLLGEALRRQGTLDRANNE